MDTIKYLIPSGPFNVSVQSHRHEISTHSSSIIAL